MIPLLVVAVQTALALANAPRQAHPFPAAETVPALHLTYTYKDGGFDVPVPPVVPDDFWQTPLGRDWADIGDVRPGMAHVEADGTRYEIDGLGFAHINGEDDKRRPMYTGVRRYRPDGTLDVESSDYRPDTGAFGRWTAYALDGRTPLLEVSTQEFGRGHAGGPATFIDEVDVYEDTGDSRGNAATYRVNEDGTIYVKLLARLTPDGRRSMFEPLEGDYTGRKPPAPVGR